MKVIALHAAYRRPGGEEQSFAQDVKLLEQLGAQVSVFVEENADMTVTGALRGGVIRNAKIQEALRPLVAKTDLLFLNNLWPSIGPGIARPFVESKVPVLQCIRNYRLACAAATLIRDGADCRICVDRQSLLPGIYYACQSSSRARSVAVVAAAHYNRRLAARAAPRWRFSATSLRTAEIVSQSGIPNEVIDVRPNFLATDPGFHSGPMSGGALFSGRLEPEKGVAWLLDLWKRTPELPTLTIAGDGTLSTAVTAAAKTDARINYVGHLDQTALSHLTRRSLVSLIPSMWEEPFGRAAMESMAVGTPVIASDRGALPEVVGEGNHLPMHADRGWAERIIALSRSEDLLAESRGAARRRFENNFSPEAARDHMLNALRRLMPGSQRT